MKLFIKQGMLVSAATCLINTANADLIAKLSLPSVQSSEKFELILTVTNTDDQAEKILRRTVGADGIHDHILDVMMNGQKIPYIGRHYKWGEPVESDYITIQPDTTVSYTLDVSDNYLMELAGHYEFSFSFDHSDHHAKQSTDSRAADVLVAWSDGVPAPLRSVAPKLAQKAGVSYERCSAEQEREIAQAYEQAILMSRDSLNVLNNYTDAQAQQSQRYSTWFGVYDRQRWDSVTNDFSKMLNDFENENVVVNCSACNQSDSVFAYVYPGRHWTIYTCNAFWRASIVGQDSKAGTLIHEMSHFNVVAGTDDHRYGHRDTKNLARNTPEEAIKNADNHEYFAENAPFIDDGFGATPLPSPIAPVVTPEPAPSFTPVPVATQEPNTRSESGGGGAISTTIWFAVLVLLGLRRRKY